MGEAQVQATLSTAARAGLRRHRSPAQPRAAPTWLWKPPCPCSPAPTPLTQLRRLEAPGALPPPATPTLPATQHQQKGV